MAWVGAVPEMIGGVFTAWGSAGWGADGMDVEGGKE